MKNKVFLSVLLGGLLLVLIAIMLPAPDTGRGQFLPWQIEHTADGATRVFGITLGETTLDEAEQQMHGRMAAIEWRPISTRWCWGAFRPSW